MNENLLSDAGIKRALDWIQDAYHRPATWSDRCFGTWAPSLRGLQGLDDDELAESVKAICESNPTCPSLAGLLEALRGRSRNRGREYQACAVCNGSGFREGAWHRSDAEGRLKVDVYALACDCPKGVHMQKAHPRWSEALFRWRQDPSTVATYCTDEHHRYLDDEERLHPDVLARRGNRSGVTSATIEAVRLAMIGRERDGDTARTRRASIERDRAYTESPEHDDDAGIPF